MKLLSLIKAVQDTISDAHRKRISYDELSVYCDHLTQKIRKDYEPDIIVAIATGGSTTGELVAKMLNIRIVHIVIRRDTNASPVCIRSPILLHWMKSLYRHYLFRTRKPKVSTNIDIDAVNKKVLIFDDTIHTGATIDAAISYLKDAGSSEIRTASLAYVSKRKPDFSVLPAGNYCFPWSKDF